MNNTVFRDKLNPESNICLGLVCQSFKITKQQQNRIKTIFFQLVDGIWGLKSCNGFCQCWKRFGSAHVRETAFNIQVLGGKWFAIRNLLYTLPTPQKVQMLRWVSGCSVGGGLPELMETPGMGRTEPFRLGLSHHPSSGAEQSWAWGTSLGTGWDISL